MSASPVILAYPGALHSAVLGLQDMLDHAGLAPLVVDAPDALPNGASAVILPPAKGAPDPSAAPWVINWLKQAASAGALICSACVGVIWIAAAGVDAGRVVTTHWGADAMIRRDWPALQIDSDRLVIEYAGLVTAGGLMAWIDLALVVIERLKGHDAMLATARHFVVDPGRRDQRRFRRFVPVTDHGDAPVLRVQQRLEQLQKSPPLAQLAKAAGLSSRSLQRRFKTATGLSLTDYTQALRIERARVLLADSSASVAEVSAAVGYTDVPAFYRVFRKITGQTPAAFRASVAEDAGAG